MSDMYTLIPPVRQLSSNESVTITYVDPSGDEHPVTAEVGQHLLDVAHNNNIELEGTSTKMQSSLFIFIYVILFWQTCNTASCVLRSMWGRTCMFNVSPHFRSKRLWFFATKIWWRRGYVGLSLWIDRNVSLLIWGTNCFEPPTFTITNCLQLVQIAARLPNTSHKRIGWY